MHGGFCAFPDMNQASTFSLPSPYLLLIYREGEGREKVERGHGEEAEGNRPKGSSEA